MTLEERQARYESMLRDIAAGSSYRQVGEQWGVSKERVRQIVFAGTPAPSGTLGHYVRVAEREAAAKIDEAGGSAARGPEDLFAPTRQHP